MSKVASIREVLKANRSCPWVPLGIDGQGLDLEDFPTFLLVRLVHSLQRNLTRSYLDPHALTMPDWRVLSFVNRYGPARFSDLVVRVLLDKAQVSRTVKHLRSRGLVLATKDPDHAQRVVLACTAAGRQMHARILPAARKSQARLLLALDASQRSELFSALHTLQGFVDRIAD
jgi:DNA-binding MarR family transcriptional regulator